MYIGVNNAPAIPQLESDLTVIICGHDEITLQIKKKKLN
jgi:hypothetical protein